MTLTEVPKLQDFKSAQPIIPPMVSSGLAIEIILNLCVGYQVLRHVNIYSQKRFSVKQHSETFWWDLLTPVEAQKHGLHYLEGANYKVLIWCDHNNLQFLQISKVLSSRQCRWLETLFACDLVNENLDGSKTPTVGPSGWPDNVILV